ncbi:MAG: rod-binding protein [Thermodesulfobacteriota bacterium]
MNLINATTNGLKPNADPADTPKERKLREACAGFEAMLLRQMLTLARECEPKGGLIDGGYGEELFRSMHDDQLAQRMASGNGMGLGATLYRQLSKAEHAR